MRKIIPVCQTILGDEKAWSLSEIHEQAPDFSGFHRYQKILVNRNDIISEFRRDMGSVKNFKGVNPICIPSFWEHSVDELLDLADELRGNPKIDVKELCELDNLKLG